MIKIFHKNTECFKKNINKTISERNTAYISFSQEKDDYFLSFKQGKQVENFCATMGMATFYKVKRKSPLQEEIILTKEYAIKQLLYCKFAYAKKLFAQTQNLQSQLLVISFFKESFRRFVRSMILKNKIKKINKCSSLAHLMNKSDLQLSLY